MTSLCPGPLFATPGLNQYSTPSSRTSTPSDIEKRFTRVPFNGIPWPKQSPVSRVYDVRNSSTKMILLNNKYTRKNGQRGDNRVSVKGCRLRGQTMNDGHIKAPDPTRHSAETPYVNRKSHTDCLTSTTPVFQPEVKTSLKWANKTQRPPLKFEDGSSVNYKRHTACMTSEDLRMMNWQRPRRPYSTSIVRESQQCNNPLLDDLNPGERLYLYSIARVYSVDSMRRLKQNQYCQLLQKEGQRGGYSAEEYRRYMKYLSSQRKTQHGATDTYQRRRIRSAPSNRDTQTDKTGTPSEQSQSRPASTKSKSRSTSRPMSRASLASNKSNKKKAQETPSKSKSDAKPSKQASDGATATNKKSPDTKTSKESTNKTAASSKTSSDRQPAKSSSEHTKPQKKSPEHEKSKTNASDNSKMAETENTEKKVVIQIQEQNQDEELDEDEAQVRGEDMVKDSDDAEDQMAHRNRGNSHKEGVDRPKSRLGGGPRAKDNSDDDYSSDSETDSSSSDESEAETSKSLSKSEPTESRTRSEPSKTSSSSQKAGSEAASPGSPPKPKVATTPSSPPRSEISKTEGSPPKDGDHDASYSEDFSEASQSVSKSQASKTDDNKRQSDSSTSEKSSDKSQLKPAPVSESKGQSSSDSESDTSSSLKPAQQATLSSDTPTTEDTSTSTSVPQVKVSQDETKVNQGDTNVSQDTEKVSDESYSEDFTESSSKSQSGDRVKGEKSPEVKVKGERAEVTFKVHKSSQNTTELNEDTGDKSNRGEEPYQRERRDSIEMDREGRVKDWDKIEY